ncbi:MAG: dethiobiotin synthase [Betaproteobacteria bacterium RBG_16_58_11]|nr:MAG: dethiobiotin synthase [Betaproteobacteria bacterium RBG_16_58_11]OFZ94547.1 MAG: dethiobiotin synthase [Betaproteobacteria bacterium RBG_19FT_COMBO_58_11]
MSGLFIAGTDTGVGKTLVAKALIERYVAAGKRVAAMKPVSAGCVQTPEGWLNDDVAQLRAASNVALPLALMNPYAFELPIAPHIAAQLAGIEIDLARIESAYREIAVQSDEVIVEGVGGLLVPLNANQTAADIVVRLNLPVILVVGMRLGCLNHALLTVEAMQQRGLTLAGWIANRIDPAMPAFDANLASLQARISAPLWGLASSSTLRWQENIPF